MSQTPKGKVWSGKTWDHQRRRNSRLNLPKGKVMLTLFWDSKGPILEDYLEKGRTINSARYSDLLANNLKPAVHTKRRGLWSKKVLLLHDNAHPHTASHTVETWVSRCWNTLPTAQISPLLTTISLDHSKMDYEVVDFLRTKKCGKRCINGCATNQKPSSWREYASLWTAGPSALKRKEIM